MTHTMKTGNGSTGTTLRQRNKSIYWAWKSMKQRCQNPRCSAYKNYGARGISVCDEWQEFEPFCDWALSNGHQSGLDLDRIDNEGNYTPDNCRWIKRQANINNRRKTLFFTAGNKTLCRTEWERILSLPNGILKAWHITHGKEYTERRIEDILINGYKERDYGYSHRRRVFHRESGMVFNSVKEAAKHFGIASPTIVNSIRNKSSTMKGTFVYEITEEA